MLASHRLRGFIIALLAAAAAAPLTAAEDVRLSPLPPATVAALGYDGDQAALVGGRPHGGAFAPAVGGRIAIDFAAAQAGPIGILRLGWPGWSLPSRLRITADGESAELALTGPGVTPNAVVLPTGLDVWRPPRPVRELRIEVLAADGGPQQIGGLALGLARPAPTLRSIADLPPGTPGILLRLGEPRPARIDCTVAGIKYRTAVRASLRRVCPPDGVLRLLWSDFQEPVAEDGPLAPRSLDTVEVADPDRAGGPVALAALEPLPAGAIPPAPWAALPPIDAALPDAMGWRPGIPSAGFGRFGWNDFWGLSVGWVKGWTWTGETCDGEGRREALTIDIRPGPPGTGLGNEQRRIDWSGADLLCTAFVPGTPDGERAAHAFGAQDARFRQAALTASLLIPGILVRTDLDRITLQQVGGRGIPRLARAAAAGLEWFDPGDPALAEGWLLAVWPEHPSIPVLIAPAHRPAAIEAAAGALTLRFAGPAEAVACGWPGGFRPAAVDGALVPACRRLAAQLRAYPRRATQDVRLPGDGTVEIRERISHIRWDNDWGEEGEAVAPVPGLAAFAADQGYPVSWPAGAPDDLGPVGKYGPWRGWTGAEALWRIPVPDIGQDLHLRPAGDALAERIAARIAEPVEAPPKGDCLDGFWLHAPAALALPLLDAAQRDGFLARWRARLDGALAARAWHLRREPFTGIAYPVSFAWRESSTNTLGDINSGVGAILTAAALYTRLSDDWAWAAEHWPALDGALRSFLVEHDWVQMQTGAREYSGSSAIDMDTIAFNGVAGYVALADGLGQEAAAARGRCLLARLGLSLGMRWIGMRWIAPALPPARWTAIGHGLNERPGFGTLPLAAKPDHLLGELALGLAWMGEYQPAYRQHIAALGPAFWRWFEHDLVERRLPDWRADHPGNRNNHPANVCAHLALRLLLDGDAAAARRELAAQAWGLDPLPAVAMENAGLYAAVLGAAAPVRIAGWRRTAIGQATWDGRTAAIACAARDGAGLDLVLARTATALRIDGRAAPPPAAGDAAIPLPAGARRVELDFAAP